MTNETLPVWTADSLTVAGIRHGFFGRNGGVSTGLYASLNGAPASQDSRQALTENRNRISRHFGGYPLMTLAQHHSADVVAVTAPWAMEDSPAADALVTATPGLILGVNTADCAPVLLADPEAKVIGAAHAGWKGALGGVCEATVAAMVALGAERGRIRAAIGPCIGVRSYEVGPGFRAAFPAEAAAFFHSIPGNEKFRFDLEAYVEYRLLRGAGVGRCRCLGLCTFARADDFFSFRRATLAGEADYGREVSAILLEP